jgi:hypothetical protein
MSTYEFHNIESAFMVSGSNKDSLPWPAAGDDRCVVVLWPNAGDWKGMGGLRFAIGDPPEVPLSWLPVHSYLALSLPVGQQTVRVTDPQLIYVNKFQCKAGQTVYIEIGKILTNNRVSVVLRTIDSETGRRVIVEMPRLLPPEKVERKY